MANQERRKEASMEPTFSLLDAREHPLGTTGIVLGSKGESWLAEFY